MKRLLAILIAIALFVPTFSFVGQVAKSAETCFLTRKGNNLRDGNYEGTPINAPALIQTWYWQSTANISTHPIACGSRIYIASNDRKTHCIDRSSGAELWVSEEMQNFPVSSPTIDLVSQSVYVATGGQIERQSVFYCFDAVTGATKWQWTPGSENTAAQISNGPTLVTEKDGLAPGTMWLLVAVDRGALFCIDAKTGTRVWAVGLNGYPVADAVVAELKVFQLVTECMLNIIDLKTGKILQQTMLDDKSLFETNNTPAYGSGFVICASRGKSIMGDKGRIYAIEASTGRMLWKSRVDIDQFHRAGPSIVKPPIVDNYSIIIGSDIGNLYMFALADGTMKWSVKFGSPITTDIVISGKYGFFGAANMLYAIDVTKGNVVFKQTLGNSITAHPIINEGMVYVACNDGKLYAFSDHDDFTIDVLPRSDATYPGNKRSYKVTISATMNFSYPLILGAVGLPNSMKTTFSKQMVFPGLETIEVDLVVDTGPETLPGNYVCNVSGLLLGRERNAILQIQVLPPLVGDFKLIISPDQLSPDRNIDAGDAVSFQIKVETIGGFNAEVAFFAKPETVPPGMRVSFWPEKIVPDGYVTCTVQSDTSSEADRYIIEVQGHAGGKIRTSNVWFVVGGMDTEEWTMFQQNHFRTGNTKEKFFQEPELRWDFTYKPDDNPDTKVRYRTQPIVGLGKCLFVGEWETKENKRIHKSALFCTDSKTGSLLWMYMFNKSVAEVDNFDDKEDRQWPVMSTPALDLETGYVYVGSIDGIFYCIDTKTGNRIWSYNTIRVIRTPVLLLKPPEASTKRVFFGTMEGTIYCMDAKTDTVLWKKDMKNKLVSGFTYAFNRAPAVNKGMILVPCFDNNVYAFDPSDGSQIWAANFFKNNPISTVAVDQEKDDFYLVGAQGIEDECYGSSMIYRNRTSDGSMHWQLATFGPVFGSPAIQSLGFSDRTIIHVNTNWGITPENRVQTNRLVRVESIDRQKRLDEYIGEWRCQSEYAYGSVIANKENWSIVANKDGKIFCFDNNGKKMFQIDTKLKSKGHPTFAKRMLYFPTEDGHMLAYSSKWGFGLAPDIGNPIVCQGNSISLNVRFMAEIPLYVPIKFKVVEAPPDTTTSFTPDSLKASGWTSLQITVGPGAPEGTHVLTIAAEGAGFIRRAMITLIIRKPAPGDFTFSGSPQKVNVFAGEPAEVGFTIDAAGGFVGAVNLSMEGMPTGVTGAFSPIITTIPGKSKYKFEIARNTLPGTYNITFRAEGGCKVHTFAFVLVVEPPVPGDYRAALLNQDERDIVMWLGETKEVGINVEFMDGYNLPVTFDVVGKNDFPGVTFTFKPSEVIKTGPVSLVIETSFTGQPVDGKRITIVTNSGRKAPKSQVSFVLSVKKEPGGFSINPKAGILNITAGQIAVAEFEVNMTSSFNASVTFALNMRDICKGLTYEFIPARLAPSRLTQRVLCVIRTPPTFLDGDAEATQKGLKECLIQAQGTGGGQRVGTRDVLLRVYKPESQQIIRFMPEYKGLKKKAADTVDIEIGNLTNACAVEFSIVYDPLAIEILDVTEGPIMTTDLKKSSFIRSIDANVGVVTVSSIREQGAGGISGTGVFCRIKLRGTNITQETRLRIANIKILDCNNVYLPVRTIVQTEPVLKVTVSGFLPGDVNGDGKVNADDLILLSKSFGYQRGDPNYNGNADFNEDGIVDGMDLIILCMNWGATLEDEGATP